MTQVILYIAASIDGYIASPDGGVDWLSGFDSGQEDYGYDKFFNSVDAVLMGSRSYEQVLTFGDWPYEGKTSFVFTKQELTSSRRDIRFVSGDPVDEMKQIKKLGFKKVWLMGGAALIDSFREVNLINEFIISTMPILLGDGIPLFRQGATGQKLVLVRANEYRSGVVQSHYRVDKWNTSISN